MRMQPGAGRFSRPTGKDQLRCATSISLACGSSHHAFRCDILLIESCARLTTRTVAAQESPQESVPLAAVPEYPVIPPAARASAPPPGGLPPWVWVLLGVVLAKSFDVVRRAPDLVLP